jgi:hypothetical protein
MSLSFNRQLTIKLALDANFTELSLQRTKKAQSMTFEVEAGGRLKLADTDGAVAADFGDVGTAKMIYVEADGAVDIALNGGAAVSYTPGTSEEVLVLLEACSVTAMTFQHPTPSSSVNVVWRVAGEE